MLLRFVFMPVYMALRAINLIMIVMEPIMAVEVLVQHRIMFMKMDMLLAEDDHKGGYNN